MNKNICILSYNDDFVFFPLENTRLLRSNQEKIENQKVKNTIQIPNVMQSQTRKYVASYSSTTTLTWPQVFHILIITKILPIKLFIIDLISTTTNHP